MILKPGKIYNTFDANQVMVETWTNFEKHILKTLRKRPDLFELKHGKISRYIIWRETKKLWKKYPKLLNVGIYANLANKHLKR